MENSNYFDEFIVSYLANELNAEEEAFVSDWINSSEQNKQYYEALENTWNLLAAKQTGKDINIDDEWDQFKHSTSAPQEKLFIRDTENVEPEFIAEVTQDGKAKVYKFFVSIAVTASVLLVIALGWRMANNDPAINIPVIVSAIPEVKENSSLLQTEINTTGKAKLLILRDGTAIKLYAGGSISYGQSFNDNKRDVWLTGKAKFKVAKDKTKPFTVFSGDISTTALGTEFTVTAFENTRNIIVRLFEGKVVIRSAKNAVRKLNNEFFLLPGQELVYDHKNFTAKINAFRSESNVAGKNNNKNDRDIFDNLSLPKSGKGTWYMFNNQSLSHVFDQLSGMFNEEIVYSKNDFSKIYFIGTFNIADSLDNILKQIASLNNLKVTRTNKKVIISK